MPEEELTVSRFGLSPPPPLWNDILRACAPRNPETGDYVPPKTGKGKDEKANPQALARAKNLMEYFCYPHGGPDGRRDGNVGAIREKLQEKFGEEFDRVQQSVQIFYDDTIATPDDVAAILRERTYSHTRENRRKHPNPKMPQLAAQSAGLVLVHEDVIWSGGDFKKLDRRNERLVKVLDVSAPILNEGDAGISHRKMFHRTDGSFDAEKYKAHTRYLIRQWLRAADQSGVQVPIFTGEGEGVFAGDVPGIAALRAQCFREVMEDVEFVAALSNIQSIVFSKINVDPKATPKNKAYEAYQRAFDGYTGTIPLIVTNKEQAEIARDLPEDLLPGLFAAGHPIQPPGNFWGVNSKGGLARAQDETLGKRVFWHVGILDPRLNHELAEDALEGHLIPLTPQWEGNEIARSTGVKFLKRIPPRERKQKEEKIPDAPLSPKAPAPPPKKPSSPASPKKPALASKKKGSVPPPVSPSPPPPAPVLEEKKPDPAPLAPVPVPEGKKPDPAPPAKPAEPPAPKPPEEKKSEPKKEVPPKSEPAPVNPVSAERRVLQFRITDLEKKIRDAETEIQNARSAREEKKRAQASCEERLSSIDSGYHPDARGKTARSPWPSVGVGGGSILVSVMGAVALGVMVTAAAAFATIVVPLFVFGVAYKKYDDQRSAAARLQTSISELKTEEARESKIIHNAEQVIAEAAPPLEVLKKQLSALPTHLETIASDSPQKTPERSA